VPDVIPLAEAPRGLSRADSVDLLLFLHVVGAVFVFGLLAAAAYYLFRARSDSSPALARVGFRTILFGVIPSYVVFRVAAQLLLNEQGLEEAELAWIDIGFIVTDIGILAIIAATIGSSIASRRPEGTSSRGAAVAAWACSLLLVAYVVALWAMTAKPA
jgi:xanthosine utilization system XapX-like protein